jgi:ribosome maturation factor RimP
MITEELIREISNEHLEGTEMFLISVKVSTSNVITVTIDGDHPVDISDCIALSRCIEGKFDREVEDFALSVMSAGIDQPYVNIRQYIKNIGREVEVTLHDGGIHKGILLSATEEAITLKEKPAKKGKKTADVALEEGTKISFSEIKQTKEIISFK